MVITKNFQKASVWFFLISAYAAFRAPVPLTIAMAYIQVGFRVMQVIGTCLKKRVIARVGYALATLFLYILFIASMAD